MCGIGAVFSLSGSPLPNLPGSLAAMNRLQAHRGPDGEGTWRDERGRVGLAHRRLGIIDLATGGQPMADSAGRVISYNGEIYNYIELRDQLGRGSFQTTSDTEVLLRAYDRWGEECLTRLRGMFAFALWDGPANRLVAARDRFGIKPLYYLQREDVLYLASEVKALLPFVREIATDPEGLRDYLAFQFCLEGKTLFKDIAEVPPGHMLLAGPGGGVQIRRYWDVKFELDFNHGEEWFESELRERMEDSVRMHLRSDVPLGAYISGGVDSAVVAALGARGSSDLLGFTGRFDEGAEYDESEYARQVASHTGMPLDILTITGADFVEHAERLAWHMDFPTAGPGSFSQYMVSGRARQQRKVMLGGQGGDETFGGYARYLIAYFEQCIKAAIDGTMRNGNFIVTYESIIPNLASLRQYKPLLQEFWRDGLFEEMDRRYFRLVNRTAQVRNAIRWDLMGPYDPFESFQRVFHGGQVRREAYFDLMTHFDFKTLLPALLHVEDRVSMAHGLESRVPLLDHPIVELAATVPPDIKFRGGEMKRLFRSALGDLLPAAVRERTDKMGFPTPFAEWLRGDAGDFARDLLSSRVARERPYVDNTRVLSRLEHEPRFGRGMWGFLSLELWQRAFHDRAAEIRRLEGPATA